jgi:hypothetical protein
MFYGCDDSLIECLAVLVENLNMRRDAVGVNHHGEHSHALNVSEGNALRGWHINGAKQYRCGDLRPRVVDPILVWRLMNLSALRYCILRSNGGGQHRQ